ncbi:MAG TPA: SUMF1/EgtB/PvdO family nonheme iron enzyme [Anaerolineae bacterium]|nr:SUMF1/EgtB/PvdO family nonheme iron enzyme [Anaerolineae bacterium]
MMNLLIWLLVGVVLVLLGVVGRLVWLLRRGEMIERGGEVEVSRGEERPRLGGVRLTEVASDGDVTVVNAYKHIVQVYSGGTGVDEGVAEGVGRYLVWVERRYGRLDLRGLRPKEQGPARLTLDDVYVSLRARMRGLEKERGEGLGREEGEMVRVGEEEIDMDRLLGLGPRLVIVGGPGSGKTTFLQLIGMSLARALRTGEEGAVRAQLGLEGALPLPIFVSLSEFNWYQKNVGRQGAREGTLASFISYTLREAALGLPDNFFERLLVEGHSCILLLDGLDEVANERERKLVRAAVEKLADNDGIRQMVVTSRTQAYQGGTVLGGAFELVEVQPMEQEQVEALVERWCMAVYDEEGGRGGEIQNLKEAIERLELGRKRRGEARLITTPLLVTIVAIVHYDRRRLPDERAELYMRAVDVLLNESNRPTTEAMLALADLGGSGKDKRQWLAYLAYEMMSAGEEAGRTVTETQLRAWLLPEMEKYWGVKEAPAKLDAFVAAMRVRGSLLSERDGVYQFTHLSFQEFLCAYYLAETVRVEEEINAILWGQEGWVSSWWRETLLLLVGYLGLNSEKKALDLVLSWVRDEKMKLSMQLAAVEVAGWAFVELDSQAEGVREEIKERLRVLLFEEVAEVGGRLRGQAGDLWGVLGDERAGVGNKRVVVAGREEMWPDLCFVYVPPGRFWMGSPDDDPLAKDREKKIHEVDIPYGYWLSQYLVTAGQYRLFLGESGYQMEGHYEWMMDDGVTRPVRFVTWRDGVAFTEWLTARWRAGGVIAANQRVLLPSEGEWEKGARGGWQLPKRMMVRRPAVGEGLPEQVDVADWVENRWPKRRYACGEEVAEGGANIAEAGVETSSVVGVFRDDKGAYGAFDMVGNLNEWTRDVGMQTYPYDPLVLGEKSNVRIWRGGGYYDSLDRGWPRCGARRRYRLLNPNHGVGFRVVVSPFTSEL